MAPSISILWNSGDASEWNAALDRYWEFVKPGNVELERALEDLKLDRIRQLDARGWYEFLRTEYFRWKYTAPNRYATTTASLAKHTSEPGGLEALNNIKRRLLETDPTDIRSALSTALEINGLGTAGASGLLALILPAQFATVDQFVVKALREIHGLPEAAAVARMKPEGLSVSDGVALIGIMARKAAENNRHFGSIEWTPRKMDKILWTYGR